MTTTNKTPEKKRLNKNKMNSGLKTPTAMKYKQQKLLSPPKTDPVKGNHEPKKKQVLGVKDKTFFIDYIYEKYNESQAGIFPSIKLSEETQGSVDSLLEIFREFNGILDEKLPDFDERKVFQKQLDEIRELLAKAEPKNFTKEGTHFIEKLKDDMKSLTSDIKTKTKNTTLVVSVVSAAIFYGIKPCTERLTIFGIACGGLLLFSNIMTDLSLFGNLIKMISLMSIEKLREDMNNDEAHSQFRDRDVDKCVTAATTLFAGYISSISGKHIPVELFKNLGAVARTKSTINEIVMIVLQLCEKSLNWCRNNIFDAPSVRFLESNEEQVEDFLRNVEELLEEERIGKFFRNNDNYSILRGHIVSGEAILKAINRDRSAVGAVEALKNIIKDLKTISKSFESSRFNMCGSRQEPVGVMFKGGPGTGKSTVMEHLVYAVCSQVLETKDLEAFKLNPAEFVHNRQYENGYWDGYKPQQIVCMFDDFGQMKDNGQNPDGEAANVIRAGSGFEMNLHMAELSNKGTTTFQSKFMFGTTNMKVLKFESIESQEALQRRWDLTFIVTPKEQYCRTLEGGVLPGLDDRRFDHSKLPMKMMTDWKTRFKPGKMQVTELNPDMQDFWLEVGTENHEGPFSFDEVVRATLDSYRIKRAQFMYQQEMFEKTVKKWTQRDVEIVPSSSRGDDDRSDDSSDYDLSYNYGPEMVPDRKNYEDLSMMEILREKSDYFINSEAESQSNFDNQMKYFQDIITRNSNIGRDIDLGESDEALSFPDISIEGSEEAEALDFLQELSKPPVYEEVEIRQLTSGFDKRIVILVVKIMKKIQSWDRETAQIKYLEFVRISQSCYGQNMFLEYPTPIIIANMIIHLGVPFVEACSNENLNNLNVQIPWNVDLEFKNPPVCYQFKKQVSVFRKAWDAVKSFYNNLWEKEPIRRILSGIIKYQKYIYLFFGSFCVTLFVKWLKPFFLKLFGVTTSESIGLSDKMHSKHKGNKFLGKSSREVRHLLGARNISQSGSSIDPSGMQLIKKICCSNLLELWVETNNGTNEFSKPGYIFMIRERIGIIPMHFIYLMQACVDENEEFVNAKVQLRMRGCKTPKYLTLILDFLTGFREGKLRDNDLVLVRLGRCVQPFKDRVSNFALRSDYGNIQKNINYVMAFSDRGDKEFFGGVGFANDKELPVNDSNIGKYHVRESYVYNAATDRGDCGAPFFVLNPKTAIRKIFGFHVAGNNMLNQGYSGAVCQEDLLEDLALFGELDVVEEGVPEELSVIESQSGYLNDGQILVYGELTPSPHRSTRSAIVKSPLHGEWCEATTSIAKLKKFRNKDDEIVDPVDMAIRKYCYPAVIQERIRIDVARDDYENFLANIVHNKIEKRLLTIREAIQGIENTEGSHGIARSTSAGYPMNMPKVENMKSFLFAEGREGQAFEDRLYSIEKQLEELEMNYHLGKRPFWVFTDCLKDERRPLEKCELGKTRLFSGCPFYYLIIWKKYFGAFQLQFYNQRVINGSAVGMNVYSTEWHTLSKLLLKFDVEGSFIGAGDFSAFDGSEKPQIHYAILDIINNWYGDSEQNKRIRGLLWLEVVNSRHVLDGLLCEWSSSLPSGHPFTIIINCMYNHLSFRLCWINMGLPIRDFNSHVYLCVCGDDNIFTVHPKYREFFNELTLSKYMQDLGLTYTTELKETAVTPFRSLTEVEFMKRSFRFDRECGLYLAPLRLEVILEIPYWSKKHDYMNIIASNTIESLRELSLHSKVIYDIWAPKIIKSFEDNCPGLQTSNPLHEGYRDRQAFTRGQELFL